MNNCEFCGRDENEAEIYFIDAFQPFDAEPSFIGYLCDACQSDIYWCEGCDRFIFDSYGLRKNIRYNEIDGMVCVSCLQEKWLTYGMGLFNEGDFFNDKDLLEHGFNKHSHYFCDYEHGKETFIRLQEAGKLVIVSITASGMGLEHHYEIWFKGDFID